MATPCTHQSSDCSLNDRRRRGLCDVHYVRQRRHGSPSVALRKRRRGAADVRWRWKIRVDEFGCWLWTDGETQGYGAYNGDAFRTKRAHRYVYQLLVRPLDDEETLDHRCRRTLCVNPGHLDPVPHAVNVARGESGKANRDKTHCKNGHEFTPENTLNNHGGRGCRECGRAAMRDYMRRRRDTAPDAVHNRDKTHCKHGHEFTEANTRRDTTGRRVCRTCEAAAQARYRERKQAAQRA